MECSAYTSRLPVSLQSVSSAQSCRMTFESWSDIAENNSSRSSFDTSASVMSNSVRSRSRSRTACLLCEEGLDRDGELAGNALQERDLGRTGIEWRYGAEAERAEPVIARSERDEHQSADPEVASAPDELRPASFRLERWRLRAAAGSAIPNRPDPRRPAAEGS